MKMFKTTWIDGYTGANLCGLKEHVGGKPHGKAMRSFKATVLKLPSENDQRELDRTFKQFTDLINLVHKEGI